MLDSITFGSPQWSTAIATLAVLAVLLVIWSYWRANSAGALGWIAGLAKLLAIAAIAFCILEPLKRSERPLPGANVMAVVIDNSRSMEVRSPGERQSRIEKFKYALRQGAPWQTRLAQDFDLRKFAFDHRIRSIEDFSEITFDGTSSSLAEAIETLQSRFAQRPIAGVLVLTDGLATDGLQELIATKVPTFPVYPVLDESDSKFLDVSISDPTVMQSAFEIAPVTVEATLRATGLQGKLIAVRLINEKGKTLDRQEVTADEANFRDRVRFQIRPENTGIQFVRVQAALVSEDRDSDQPFVSRTEVTSANNTRLVAVDRGGGPYRILYVAGRPNWEFKFLRRAVQEDAELRLTGLLRIAKKEPKFSFRDRGVDSTNPLFAGFDEKSGETAEQYDEPVMLRVGIEGKEELQAGFPKTEETLYEYEAIILDDIEAEFFSQEQMLLMRKFVGDRGGGLMMLGGQETFSKGNYKDTPLGDLLPVYVRSEVGTKEQKPPVRYRLTREGSLEPWTRLRASQADEVKRVAEMPLFMTWNTVADVKPGASVLAEIVTEDDKTQPGLITQRFGKGRTAALTVGDFWRWSLRRSEETNDDLAQTWRQIARWLTADVPKRIEVDIDPPSTATGPHTITVALRDAEFKPMDNATVELSVLQPDQKLIPASVTPDPKRSGYYIANYWSQLDGSYVLSVDAKSPDGEIIDSLESGWTAEPSAAEFANLVLDRAPLEALAAKTGGEVVAIDDIETFAASLTSRKVPITETRVEPLWHKVSILVFALSCLCFEWGIRRWRGLP